MSGNYRQDDCLYQVPLANQCSNNPSSKAVISEGLKSFEPIASLSTIIQFTIPMQTLKPTFDKILKATSSLELEELCRTLEVPPAYHLDVKKYPKLNISLSKTEIVALEREGSLSSSYELNLTSSATPLEKLLYAFLWKQGDLLKIKHIVQGIMSEEMLDDLNTKEDGLVFYNFGKSIRTGSQDPIVDQHVLRAFSLYQRELYGDSFDTKLSKLKHKKDLIAAYKKWFFDNFSQRVSEDPSFKYHLDRILYALGKNAKP